MSDNRTKILTELMINAEKPTNNVFIVFLKDFIPSNFEENWYSFEKSEEYVGAYEIGDNIVYFIFQAKENKGLDITQQLKIYK